MKGIIMKKKLLLLPICILLLSFISGCSSSETSAPISKTSFLFDTVVTITVYDKEDAKLLDHCFQICEEYENLLSRTISGSDIDKLNHADGKTVSLSADTVSLIKDAVLYHQLSNGSFDITIGTISTLWDFTGASPVPVPSAIINEKLEHVNSSKIHINNLSVTLEDPETAIDLGGIAKGYIADRLKEYLSKNGVEHALIDLGGNILTIGEKPNGTPYQIGIKKPFDENGGVITTVAIENQSVVTSGIYERYFEYNEKLYHHILSPLTGYPVCNNLLSVTIISDCSKDGDALSTSCMVLGLEEGMSLIESIPDIEAIFITDDYKLHYSTGLKDKTGL